MGVYTFTMADLTSPVAPARLFHAFAIDNHNLMPKVVPESVKSVEFIQGDSTAVGCIKQINFPDGAPFKYVKNRVEEIDMNKCYVKYTTFEGDVLRDTLEYVVYENNFEASSGHNAGTHFKMVGHFHTKGDHVMTEQHVANGKQNIKKMFEAVEAHLIANPQLYA